MVMEDHATLRPVTMELPEIADASGTKYRPGSDGDFEQLYRDEYQHVLFFLRAILRNDHAAEDCAQESFVRAYRAWDRWRPEAPASHWLLAIAHRVALSHVRAQRIRALVSHSGDVEELMVAAPMAQPDSTVMDAVRSLPVPQRVCVVLRYGYGYTNREIGKILRTSESTIASRLSLARSRLEKELQWADEQ